MLQKPRRHSPQVLLFSLLFLSQATHHQRFNPIFRIFDSKPNSLSTRIFCCLSILATPRRPHPTVFSSRQTDIIVTSRQDPARTGRLPTANGVRPIPVPIILFLCCLHLVTSKSMLAPQSHQFRTCLPQWHCLSFVPRCLTDHHWQRPRVDIHHLYNKVGAPNVSTLPVAAGKIKRFFLAMIIILQYP